MKTKTTSNPKPLSRAPFTSLLAVAAAVVCVGAAILISSTAQAQNLFESDYGSGNIYEFTPGGSQSTFAFALDHPLGLAFDSAGNLFAAEQFSGTSGTSRIDKFTPDGTRSTFASGLNTVEGLAFDSAGNLFAAEYYSGNIYKFTPDGTRSTFASGLNDGATGLAFDSAGNLFVGDYVVGVIYKITPGGTRSTFASGLAAPTGLAFDSAGNLFAAELRSGTIYKFTPDGTRSTFASGMNAPYGLAFDSAGNLFVGDTNNNTIYEFTPSGTQSTFASGLYAPTFLAFLTPYSAQVQQPINPDGSSVFNVRRGVVPVKFTLTLNGTPTCALPPATIALTRTSGGTTGTVDESVYVMAADNGPNFRIDGCQYAYNLNSSALGVGTYRVDIKINGQVVGNAVFQLK